MARLRLSLSLITSHCVILQTLLLSVPSLLEFSSDLDASLQERRLPNGLRILQGPDINFRQS